MNLKLRFLRTCVFSIATYGSESWALTKNDRKRVDAFEMWCYRRLLRVSWKDKRTNDWVLSKVGCEVMLRKTIDSRKLRYFGHISRKDGSIVKLIMQGTVEGSRGRGRPSTSWTDDIKRNSEVSFTAATRLEETELVGDLLQGPQQHLLVPSDLRERRELFQPIVLGEKKKKNRRLFCSFSKHFLEKPIYK